MQDNALPDPSLTREKALANLVGEDLSLRYYAAWWLGRMRVNDQEAVDALMVALSDEADRTELGGYPLRRNAARALGKLGDVRAVPALMACLECEDFYVREAAAQSLAVLGDNRCVAALRQLLAGGVEAAQQMPGQPHLRQPYEDVLEALGALKAQDAVAEVAPFLEHPVPRVRLSAARAMYSLTGERQYAEQLVRALEDPDINLRRVALSDLGAVGYLEAAQPIARARTENSFKLFALKGLLDVHLNVAPSVALAMEPHPENPLPAVLDLIDNLL
ncbi:HEAT repeat domain-containing protein [Leptolyngbya sp. FACHB-261]|uniref:HEAT repeat domain-containing protein n=1 Tax=Leptolyngbya sp. FACHB-261 TaxID=2692806 RepID=UPI00168229C4|nr:HEAT repeat domain-containing protein [Leptolyngbya sp. FACHB-261]MBD2104509.1 HEAT repeat domain-containing protein [Leptolyngbya sp. FACHB-261]